MLYFQKNTLTSFPNCNKSHISSVRELHRWPCKKFKTPQEAVFFVGFLILARVRKLSGKNSHHFTHLRTFYLFSIFLLPRNSPISNPPPDFITKLYSFVIAGILSFCFALKQSNKSFVNFLSGKISA